jgi:cell division protein FtsI (penicillin-binding protein 3)
MAIGYEVAISPMHTCMVYNAVANSGKMMKPYLVSAIRQYGKDEVQIQPTVLVEKIADSSTISQLQQCLRYVVTDGTAKGIESPYYTMCGKTGTAQVADKGITYADGVYQGSFVGYFPAEAPQYTVCVVIRTHAHANNYYGGAIAAPVFRMVADKLFAENMGAWKGPLDSLSQKGAPRFHAKLATGKNYKLLLNALHKGNVEIDEENESLMKLTSDSTRRLSVRPANIVKNVMPDLKGMGLRDAVYILESFGMKVNVKGKGKVQSQSVEPGVRLKKEQIITLQLS